MENADKLGRGRLMHFAQCTGTLCGKGEAITERPGGQVLRVFVRVNSVADTGSRWVDQRPEKNLPRKFGHGLKRVADGGNRRQLLEATNGFVLAAGNFVGILGVGSRQIVAVKNNAVASTGVDASEHASEPVIFGSLELEIRIRAEGPGVLAQCDFWVNLVREIPHLFGLEHSRAIHL